ncbi:MAG TPA: response regulator [Candidatus Binatia bacterium]|nr:response regulator [Methylomirabilota bacterium]HVM86416.1 response regulator [Candidatus Binatia bacterium]
MNQAEGSVGRRIIVVDDDAGVREMVAEYLTQHGFSVRTADSAAAFDRLFAAEHADLILLDVNMPGEDGFSLARRLRAAKVTTPIIMLTAMGDVIDRVVGLEIGSDDYIVKPFDLRELRARIAAVLRRIAPAVDEAKTKEDAHRVAFGAVVLDLDARRLIRADGSEEKLTAMEFDLLQAFARHPNRVLSRDTLLDLAHHKEMEPFDRSIDIRIARLRRKIETDPSKPQVIKTERGGGYIFVSRPNS